MYITYNNGKLFTLKERNPVLYNDMDESGGHHAM